MLGDTITAPTLSGPVTIRIPPGSQPGQRFRIRGRGLPDASGAAGDLVVALKVVLPKSLTRSERALWEKLAQT